MQQTTIYGSSGNVRFPTESDPINHDEKEAIRDLFFDSIYLKYSEGCLKMFFEAHTSSPEQFVGEVCGLDKNKAAQTGYEALVNVVEHQLEWTLPDGDASDGHRLFQLLPRVASIGPSLYDSHLIDQAAAGGQLDFGVPDVESAVGLFKWLLTETQNDLSTAIAFDGRTQSLSEVDIVIVPDETESQIRGINGSHEQLTELFTNNAVSQTISVLNDYIDRPEIADTKAATRALVDAVDDDPLRISKHNFAAFTPQSLQAYKEQTAKTFGIIFGVISFVAAFIISGGPSAIGDWWGESIVATSEVELPTLAAIESATTLVLPPVSTIGVVLVSSILLIGWASIGLYVFKQMNAAPDNTGSQSQQTWQLSGRHHEELSGVVTAMQSSELTAIDQYLGVLADNTHRINANIVIEPTRSITLSLLLWAVGSAVLLGGAFGGVGYVFGYYTELILQQWVILSELVIGLSIIGVVVFGGFLLVKLFLPPN